MISATILDVAVKLPGVFTISTSAPGTTPTSPYVFVAHSYGAPDAERVAAELERVRSTATCLLAVAPPLPRSPDWWTAAAIAIEGAAVFLFVTSRLSLNSSACLAELEHALSLPLPIVQWLLDPVPIDRLPSPLHAVEIVAEGARDTGLIQFFQQPRFSRLD